MRATRFACVALMGVALTMVPRPALAQTAEQAQTIQQQIDQLRKEFGDRLAALEAQLAAIQGAQPAPPLAPPAPSPTTAEVPSGAAGAVPLPVYGAATAGAKVFNPDIGMIGNFIGGIGPTKGGSETLAPIPAATLQESELSLQAIIDPYARGDFFLAIGEEGIEVEEGYVSFPALPGGLLVKAGKMRANFGRLNAFHNHTLPWIDRPLVMYNLLGGSAADPDTGIKDAGVSVSRLIPAGKVFVEATGEVFRGDSGTVFTSRRRSDVSTIGHLRSYLDLTEATNLEGAVSFSRGHNDAGGLTRLYGTDVTLRWRPLARAIYHSFTARTELIWSQREEPRVVQRAFGLYGSLDYQFARRWFGGVRYDRAERGREASILDKGGSAVLTFWPSEFSQVRGQYRRMRFGEDGRVANELLFQLLFTMGAHGAHSF